MNTTVTNIPMVIATSRSFDKHEQEATNGEIELSKHGNIIKDARQPDHEIVAAAALEDIANGTNNFTLDMQKVQYIDSTGLGIIAHAARNINDKEGQITIICNQPQIRKIFEISGLQNKNIRLLNEEEG